MPKFHIGYIVSHYPHPAFGNDGGLGTSIYNLVEQIRKEDIRITVFVYGQKENFELHEENVSMYSLKQSWFKLFNFYFSRKKIERFIKSKIKSDGINILEAPDWTGITAFMNFDIPLVIRFHGSDTYFCHLEKRKQKIKNYCFEKWAVSHADAFISPTVYAGEVSKKLFGIKNKPIETIHYGLKLQHFQNQDPNHYDRGLVLYIGNVIRKKGVLELPKIFHLVRQKHPEATLVIVGSDSSDVETNSKSTWQLAKETFDGEDIQNVSYVGPILYHQVQAYIKRANVCIFPTFAETLGMVTIESMALQKPVVNSNIGWSQELIEDGESGYLVHPKDHVLYANRICDLLESESLCASIGTAARAKVEKQFNIERIVEQNFDFYTKILNKKN